MPAVSVPDVSQTTWFITSRSSYSMREEGNFINNYGIIVLISVAVEFIVETLIM